jgi:hypothetical protein
VVAAVGLLVLVGAVAVLVMAKGWLGDKVDDLARDRQEIVDETGIETGSTDTVHPPQRDIRLGACEFDDADGVQASGTLTNWTGDTSDYRISLSFREGNGGQGSEFGATVVTVENVDGHATTNWSSSVPVRPADGSYTCRVVRIDRWSSGEEPPTEPGS